MYSQPKKKTQNKLGPGNSSGNEEEEEQYMALKDMTRPKGEPEALYDPIETQDTWTMPETDLAIPEKPSGNVDTFVNKGNGGKQFKIPKKYARTSFEK